MIVTTHSQETIEFVVTEVTEKALRGTEQQIELIDIAELRKVAWERPPSPCGGDAALGCSVPLLVSLASKEHAHYREEFGSGLTTCVGAQATHTARIASRKTAVCRSSKSRQIISRQQFVADRYPSPPYPRRESDRWQRR